MSQAISQVLFVSLLCCSKGQLDRYYHCTSTLPLVLLFTHTALWVHTSMRETTPAVTEMVSPPMGYLRVKCPNFTTVANFAAYAMVQASNSNAQINVHMPYQFACAYHTKSMWTCTCGHPRVIPCNLFKFFLKASCLKETATLGEH